MVCPDPLPHPQPPQPPPPPHPSTMTSSTTYSLFRPCSSPARGTVTLLSQGIYIQCPPGLNLHSPVNHMTLSSPPFRSLLISHLLSEVFPEHPIYNCISHLPPTPVPVPLLHSIFDLITLQHTMYFTYLA